jgi:flagellar hook-basal body complex protein FliE
MSIDATRLMAMRTAILEQNVALQRAAGRPIGTPGEGDGATRVGGFGDALRSALDQVSEAYERGETTDIASVMLARQQASIGFEATLQVRNRLLTAYKDIMSMPV